MAVHTFINLVIDCCISSAEAVRNSSLVKGKSQMKDERGSPCFLSSTVQLSLDEGLTPTGGEKETKQESLT